MFEILYYYIRLYLGLRCYNLNMVGGFHMKIYKFILISGIFILGLFLFSWSLPVSASPNYQLTPFPTPTPGGDGNIWYLVQPYDTLWRISAVSGVSLDELRLLNNMDPDDILGEGQLILLGYSNLSNPTSDASDPDNAVPVTETPVPDLGTAIICILLYDDVNGDTLRQDTEGLIEGGAVSLTEQTGMFSETRNTSVVEEEYCFGELPGGKYNITMAIPEGYNPTSTLTTTLTLNPGDSSIINFGAQESYQTQSEGTASEEPGVSRSPLMGLLGLALLLGGIGLALYTSQIGSRKSESDN